MSYLHSSLRCRLFERISEKIWDRIVRKHDLNLNDKEEGITNDIVADLLEYHATANNFDVYATYSYQESVSGADIEVFVETEINEYAWFPLQAKLLKKDGKYHNLFYPSKSEQQWELLIKLKNYGAQPYYLFYNGESNVTHLLIDKCGRQFNAKQFGCSLVPPETVSAIYNQLRTPSFSDFHPQHAQPWRILVCCKIKPTRVFGIAEVLSTKSFLKLEKVLNLDKNSNDEGSRDTGDLNKEKTLLKAYEETGWKPEVRIIVKRTTGR